MAIVRPLFIDSANDLKELSDFSISGLVARAAALFVNNPSVYLQYVSSNGNLGNMTDTRYQAGTATSDNTNFDTAAETPNISLVTVNYSRINQVIESVNPPSNTNGYRFPIYYDSFGDIRSMSNEDIYDTFAKPAITLLTNSGSTIYTISRSASIPSFETWTNLGTVFTDTGADASAYTAGGIPETRDQPTTINNYSLFKRTADVPSSFSLCRYDGEDVISLSNSYIDSFLEEAVRYVATSIVGSRIRFSINGEGRNTGTAVDTRLNGTGIYRTRRVGDDYRSQEMPNGTFVTVNTYNLRIRKI